MTKRHLALLMLISVVVTAIATFISARRMYDTAIEQNSTTLSAMARAQAETLEAVLAFDEARAKPIRLEMLYKAICGHVNLIDKPQA